MIGEIATVGHPVLRQRATEITLDELASAETQSLVEHADHVAQFDRHHRDAFVARVTELVARVGS